MAALRKAAFSGSWYPGSADQCEAQINAFLDEGRGTETRANLVGGIVPHAGWFFSGSIACNAIQALSRSMQPDVVVVFGMHMHPGSTPCMYTTGEWETPFGNLPVAMDLAGDLAAEFTFSVNQEKDFFRDNTIELQLPFVKYFCSSAEFVPIGVPPAPFALKLGAAAVEIAARKGLKLMVIGSTDLTHYGPNYGFMSKGTGPAALDWVRDENDKKVIEAMVAMQPEEVIRQGLANHNACCSGAAAAALSAGVKAGAQKGECLTYATSADKSPGSSFVGYVGVVF
ncbi:MAG: AmmeMemoRadiSam system protein B [Desulfobacterales bacterium]|nr:AmmeMemoRadiSam system protein B [Desulfobacterales bacterium]